MAAIAVRRLGAEDVADYRSIRLAALMDYPEAFESNFKVEATRPIRAFSERLSSSLVFGAYENDRVVGMAGFKQEVCRTKAHSGFVWGIFVRSDLRRRGIGSALVQAIRQAMTPPIEQITLKLVDGNDAAMALYIRCGFTIYGREPRALKLWGVYRDEILMVKVLPQHR